MADAAKAATAQLKVVVVPTAESAEKLIKKIDDLRKSLDKWRKLPADFSAHLKLLEEQLAEVKAELKFTDHALDPTDWAAKTDH